MLVISQNHPTTWSSNLCFTPLLNQKVLPTMKVGQYHTQHRGDYKAGIHISYEHCSFTAPVGLAGSFLCHDLVGTGKGWTLAKFSHLINF
jgi:hypothetical protein